MNILSEIKLSYNRVNVSNGKLTNSKMINDFAHSIVDDISLQERFYAIFLDAGMNCVGFLKVADGGIDAVMVDNRLIYATALSTASKRVVLVHNHPSGNINPSTADKSITERIRKGLETLDIQLIDHLIITDSKEYFSFADEHYL